MKTKIFPFLLLPFLLIAQESPEQIHEDLAQAEAQFEKAKEMFNPWYTGPLLTPSASLMPVGAGYVQPYVFFVDNYSRFNADRESIELTNQRFNLVPVLGLATGITHTMDFNLLLLAAGNWQGGNSGGGFGDITATLGFPICFQTRYVPQIKFTIAETFPTGQYKNLNSNGLNLSATGQGAFQTQLGLAFSKLFFWTTQHPFNTRLFLGYEFSTDVNVSGFNTYGGGYGTKGTVRPGDLFSADLGLELSLTQRWVLATDIVYTYYQPSHFTGDPGHYANGYPAFVGGLDNDNLSLSPAIEYNWSPYLGIVAGAWFSVYGRNSFNFASGVISLTCYFQ